MTASKAMLTEKQLSLGIGLGSLPLFNIYTYDLSFTISRKFAYADEIALVHSSGNWDDFEGIEDMTTLSVYLQTWKLVCVVGFFGE